MAKPKNEIVFIDTTNNIHNSSLKWPRKAEKALEKHGDRFNAVIQIINRYPINQDYPDAWQTVNKEVYYFPRGDAKDLEILSYAYDSTSTQQNWPVEWVVEEVFPRPPIPESPKN